MNSTAPAIIANGQQLRDARAIQGLFVVAAVAGDSASVVSCTAV